MKHVYFIFLLSISNQLFAAAPDKETLAQSLMGISTYAGLTLSNEDEQGYFVGTSLYMYFFNWALEAKSFPSDQVIKPYMGLGLGRLLQVQQELTFSGALNFRVVSEIAFDEFVETRHHWTLHLSAEKLDTDDTDDMRYQVGLGYTF
jgi:hypothetical protein